MTKDRRRGTMGTALALAGLGAASIAATSTAATLSVPEDHATIQAAVLAASPGDTVLVAPGRYRELIQMKNGVVLRSAAGPDSTILETPGIAEALLDERIFECRPGIDRSTVIEGFTMESAGIRGAAIWCEEASPVIRGNVIRNFGWGVNLRKGSNALLEDNVIRDCIPFGVMIFASSPELRRNDILRNRDRGIAISGAKARPIIGGRAEYANRIVGNDFAIVNQSRNDIDATYNDWGWIATIEMERAEFPADISLIIDGNDRGESRKGKGSVDYRHWRQPKEPDATTAADTPVAVLAPPGEPAGAAPPPADAGTEGTVAPGSAGTPGTSDTSASAAGMGSSSSPGEKPPPAGAASGPRWLVPGLIAIGIILLFAIISRRGKR